MENLDWKQALTLGVGVGLGTAFGAVLLTLLSTFGIRSPASRIRSRIRYVTGDRHHA